MITKNFYKLDSKQKRNILTYGNINLFSPLHLASRERVIKSHMKYFKFVANGTIDEFQKLLLSFIRNGRTLLYCQTVFLTLYRAHRQKNASFRKPLSLAQITRAYKQMGIIKDAQGKNALLYDDKGFQVQLNHGDDNALGSLKHATTTHLDKDEIDELYKQALNIINDFISHKIAYDATVEMSIFIFLLYCTGSRKAPLLNMTDTQLQSLISGGSFSYLGKTGNETVNMGPQSRQILFEIYKIRPKIAKKSVTSRIFHYSYFKLRREFIQFYKKNFHKKKPAGALFHVFRSAFAATASDIDPLIAQKALNHKSFKTTRGYIRNQKLNDNSLTRKLLEKIEEKVKGEFLV